MSAELLALLDGLDAAREKATPGEWQRWRDQEGLPGWDGFIVLGDDAVEGEECNPTARVYIEPDAALIVAEHNAMPKLTAALRAVEALADELEREAGERQRRAERTPGSAPFAADRIRLFAGARHQRLAAAQLRAAIAAALTPEQADR